MEGANLSDVKRNVLSHSENYPESLKGAVVVGGYNFSKGVDFPSIMSSYMSTGFQATNLALAIQIVKEMLHARVTDPAAGSFRFPAERQKTGCSVFLGFTSNMVSSGIRDVIRYLVETDQVDCLVTTGGGIEEDFIKCLAPTLVGDFRLDGSALRQRGLNRIGNLLVPNDNYCLFEEWVNPILDQLLVEQNEMGVSWTPSKIIWRLGKEIDNPQSIYYWAFKHSIPVFCPGLTDGSLGDMMYFHSYKNGSLKIDILEDLRHLNNMAVDSVKSGMIILGGGIVKHHICNANLMRNGADFSVFINTGQEFDGSDSGAPPDEAVSWGKIKPDAKCVKVCSDATLIFPLLVAETFAKTADVRSPPQ